MLENKTFKLKLAPVLAQCPGEWKNFIEHMRTNVKEWPQHINYQSTTDENRLKSKELINLELQSFSAIKIDHEVVFDQVYFYTAFRLKFGVYKNVP